MKIELHIDRLVVDADGAAAIDRARLARAVSQALAQRIDAAHQGQGQGQSQGQSQGQGQGQGQGRPAPRQGSIAGLEQRIAAALHQAIPGAARGGRP